MNGVTSTGLAVEVGDDHVVGAQVDDLVLPELDGVAGELDERRRRRRPGSSRPRRSRRPAGSCAGRPRRRPGSSASTATSVNAPDSRWQTARMASARSPVSASVRLQQVRHDLGVGLRGHDDPALGQLVGELGEVLDDPVVDDRDAPAGRHVRVGVDVRRPAVGGPAGVPDPRRGGRHRVGRQQRPQVLELARLLAHVQGPVGHDGHAGGVVAAVLQALQARHDDVHGLPMTRVPHDSTHGPKGSRPAVGRRSGRA